jgi:hypothetical protein
VKFVTRIVFASAFALSTIAPAFAYETALEFQTEASTTVTSSKPHATANRTRTHRTTHAMDAKAYEPADVPIGVDFSIGSQR